MRAGGLAVVVLLLWLASAAQAPARGVGAAWSVLHLPLEGPGQRVRVARLDADEFPDLVYVSGAIGGGSPSRLGVLRNTGGFGFRRHWQVDLLSAAGKYGIPLDVGDLDGDGHTDLVTANHSDNWQAFLHYGDGSGSFASQQTFDDYGGQMEDVLIVDDDGDGDLEIATATDDGGQLYFLDRFTRDEFGNYGPDGFSGIGLAFYWGPVPLSSGSLTPAPGTDYLVCSNFGTFGVQVPNLGSLGQILDGVTARAVAADFDGDGLDDVAASLPLRHQVKVARSQGVFPVPGSRSYAVGREPRGLAPADLDLDGDLDLAVANHGSGTVSLLINGGSGQFDLADTVPVAPGPVEIEAADLDLDGDSDLVVAHRLGHSLAVLRNPAR